MLINTSIVLIYLTFIIETVNPIDRGTFVIATEDKEILRIFDFIR